MTKQQSQVRRIVILAPHPRCFQDDAPGFLNLQQYAKQMDEATCLVEIPLPRWSYWSDLVIEGFGEEASTEEESMDEEFY